MPHSSTPIAVITLSFGVGILLRDVGFQPQYLYLLLCATALLLSHFKKWYRSFWIATAGCFLVLGMVRYTPPKNFSISKPRPHEITITKTLNTHLFGHQYLIKINANESALLQTSLDNIFTVGDRFLIHGNLAPIAPPKNPTDFDFKTYMQRKGVSRKVLLSTPEFVPLTPKVSPRRWAHQLQQKLIQQLHKSSLSADSKALIMALILGNKTDISEERIAQYKRAGAMHLLAISGLHIGIVLLLLRVLVAPLKRFSYGRILAAALPVVLLWCFALITGGSPSVVRAVTMFSFLQLGLALRRKNASIQGVWVSCVVLLFIQPRMIFDVGFQLSYSAVFGIVWMMPHWQRLFIKTNPFVRYFTSLVGLGCIAQLSVLPLSLLYFHQFPLLFWVSNLVLVPFVGVIILLGIGCVVASYFSALYWVYPIIDFVFKSYQNSVAWIAQWEGFFIEHIPFRTTDALLLGVVVIVLFLFFEHPNNKKTVLLGVMSLLFHGQLYMNWERPPQAWITHVYKNSLLITTHQNNLIAFSAAKDPKIERIAEQFQQHYRLDNIVYKPLQQTYNNLLVVDSLGVYNGINRYETVLLRQSPKIHLAALIANAKPTLIIADGSNYPSFIKRWEKTCVEKNIRFHATSVAGAYPLN